MEKFERIAKKIIVISIVVSVIMTAGYVGGAELEVLSLRGFFARLLQMALVIIVELVIYIIVKVVHNNVK